MELSVSIRIVPAGRSGDDRAAVFAAPMGHLFVLADGAGGTSGGAAAADAVVTHARSASLNSSFACVRSLEALDQAVTEIGQTTAILLVVSHGQVFGASVGDSAAWLLDPPVALDLTENQTAKPLLGSGQATAVPFGPFPFRGRVLLGSDGLFKYVGRERIQAIASAFPLDSVADELVSAARLPSGRLQDDIAIILAGKRIC